MKCSLFLKKTVDCIIGNDEMLFGEIDRSAKRSRCDRVWCPKTPRVS